MVAGKNDEKVRRRKRKRRTRLQEEEQELMKKYLVKRGEVWMVRTAAWRRDGNGGEGCVGWTEIPLVVERKPLKYLGLREHMRQ